MLKNEQSGIAKPVTLIEDPCDQKKRASVGDGSPAGAVVDIIWLSLPLIIALPLMALFNEENIKEIFILTEWGMISISLVLLALTRRVVTVTHSKRDISEISNGIKLYVIFLSLCLFSYIVSFIASRGYFVFGEIEIFCISFINVFLCGVAAFLNFRSIVSK